MSSTMPDDPLLEFPKVAALPCADSHGIGARVDQKFRRDALEDLLNDPQYLQAIVHTLPQAQQITQAQAELGSANEALARVSNVPALSPIPANTRDRAQCSIAGAVDAAAARNAGRVRRGTRS